VPLRHSAARGRVVTRVVLAAALATLGTSLVAAPAGAETREVGCESLQTTINEAAADGSEHGAGDVIVLNGMCTAGNLGSSSGVTIPAESNFSIEGKAGTTSGFDGAGISGPLLGTAGAEKAGAIALSNLTFQHADLSEASALSIQASRVTLSGDTFSDNDERGANAHAAFVSVGTANCTSGDDGPAITVTDSKFLDNKLVLGSSEGGGAGAALKDACASSTATVEGDSFEGNVLEAAGTPEEKLVVGAGLFFEGPATVAAAVSQHGNVFDSNTITSTAPAVGDYGGGGEWLEDASLDSVDDRFSRNSVPGTVAADTSGWGWAGGLGIITPVATCSESEYPESTLVNAVVEGNAITPGKPPQQGGGGIWVGCIRLRVLDSTVTLNASTVAGGIEGEPQAHLELENSIVSDNFEGPPIAGFNEHGGSVTATYSDVCAGLDSTSALAGAGNICAPAHLVDEGNKSSFDVHETEASPTIDVGSNALVPDELTTDFYDNTRILAGAYKTPGCTPPATVFAVLDAPVVDMGASEFGPIALPKSAIECQAAKRSVFAFPSVSERAKGKLVLKFPYLTAGKLRVRATFKVTKRVAEVVNGRRVHVKKASTVVYAHVTVRLTGSGKGTLDLQPTKRALAALRDRKHLSVRLAITFRASGAKPIKHVKTIRVVYHP
jgi:hypothetical protein